MKIEKSECNYQVTECDLKFGEQITLDGELLIPVSVLDKIRSEIETLNPVDYVSISSYEGHRGASDMKEDVLQIIDKYEAKRSE